MNKIKILCFMMFIPVCLIACDDETPTSSNAGPASSLVVSPASLIVTDRDPEATFYVSTDSGGAVEWQVRSKPAWLTVYPDAGKAGQGDSPVSVIADMSGLQVGSYFGRIELNTPDGIVGITVFLNNAVNPRIEADVSQLDYPDSVSHIGFKITNTGTGILSHGLVSSAGWLSLGRPFGYLSAGRSFHVWTSVDRSGLAIGEYNARVTSNTNSEHGEISLPVNLSVPASTVLETAPDTVKFDYFTSSRNVMVHNVGNWTMDWSASASDSFIHLTPASGEVEAFDSLPIAVTIDRAELGTAIHFASINVVETTGQSATIPISINHYVEEKFTFEYNIVDAEYDTVDNVIIAISTSPDYCLIIDPFGESVSTIALPMAPTCIGVRPDGAVAGVGHNGFVSEIDLISKSLVQTHDSTADAKDIILALNGWAYITPALDGNTLSLDLSTGSVTKGTGSYSVWGRHIRLHPSGDYAYSSVSVVGIRDMSKFDLRSDTAVFLYNAPSNGFLSGGNVWISEDGSRLYSRGGNTFRSSTIASDDMKYTGAFEGGGPFGSVAHSLEAGRIVGVSEVQSDSINIYHPDFLSWIGAIQMPPFFVPDGGEGGTVYSAKPRFVFFDGPGLNYVTMMKIDSSSGLANRWAVTVHSVSGNP